MISIAEGQHARGDDVAHGLGRGLDGVEGSEQGLNDLLAV